MIDIHCHIIPGIDDGAPDLRTSVNMAKIASSDGIKSIIATPHIIDDSSLGLIEKKVEDLQAELDSRGIDISLFSGGEVPFRLLSEDDKLITLGGSDYILVEFPPDHVPLNALGKFRELIERGYKIVIAHPERNLGILRKPKLLKELLIPNVFTQVTAMSLKGSFGQSIRLFSGNLLKKGMIDFIASDSHESAWRVPELSFLMSIIRNKKELKKVDEILNNNSKMILENV